jgi:hypothetical protein
MDLERQFIDFQNYVPYLDGNETVYSFRLMNLILAIGAHVDSAFKEMFRCSEFSKKYDKILRKINTGKATITDYLTLEQEYCISKRGVVFKRLPEREVVVPFQKFGALKSPDWWTAYNEIKHEFSLNFKKANLKNVRDALAGAFLLNVVHKPAILRLFKYGVAKSKYREVWSKTGGATYSMRPTVKIIQDILKDTIYPPLSVKTTLFYFDCEVPDMLNV